jgi:predicted enzyme related to lactoylglutathione lyase
MTTQLAFVAYPVSDISASRRFYDTALAVSGREATEDWIEYDLRDGTFAITKADAEHPTPVRGALAAFEVADTDAEVRRLRGTSVSFSGDIVETPVCRFIVARDPDGSEFLIHQRKTHSVST